jgi:Rrf2 family protein
VAAQSAATQQTVLDALAKRYINSIFMIKLTTRGHYSVKALLDLTLQPGYGPASVAAIAQRQSLPAPYLEKLLIELRRAEIVKSIRGVQGGYQLKQHPSDISLGQILEAVGEAVEPLANQEPDEQHAGDWVTFTLWNTLHQKMRDALFSISLEDLYYDARSRQAAQGETTSFIV